MMLRVLFLLCCVSSLTAMAAPLPVPDQGPALRIQGSNTIGAALGPALVKGLMTEQGLQGLHSEPSDGTNEQRVVGQTRQGKTVTMRSPPMVPAPVSPPSKQAAPTWLPRPVPSRTANWWTSNPWAT